MGFLYFTMSLLTTGFFWRNKDLYLREINTPNDFIFDFKSANENENNQKNILPLLPEANPTFPGSRKLLYLNEMRFRSLLQTALSDDDSLIIRAYVDNNGGIHPIAVKCKILEAKYLKTGQCIAVIEAIKRVQIKSVTLDSQYLVADYTGSIEEVFGGNLVENINDEVLVKGDVLCNQIFIALKKYLRLSSLQRSKVSSSSGNESLICFSPHVIRTITTIRNAGTNNISSQEKSQAHCDFSDAIGNFVSTTPEVMQAIFSSETNLRLQGLLRIVETGLGELMNELEEQMVVSLDEIEKTLAICEDLNDNFESLKPPPDYEELNLSQVVFEDEEEEKFMNETEQEMAFSTLDVDEFDSGTAFQ